MNLHELLGKLTLNRGAPLVLPKAREHELTKEQREGALHALIIATSRYDALPGPNEPPLARGPQISQLDCIATGGYNLAVWLRDHFHNTKHPVGTIRVLLSPTEAEVAKGVPNTGTRSSQVMRALEEWRTSCLESPDGMALLYAAGHGFRYGDRDALVLLQDYRPTEHALRYCLDVARVRKGMTRAGCPEEQIYFVDACRSDVPADFDPQGTGLGWNRPRDPIPVSAPVFFAAASGSSAYQDVASTYFVQGLLQSLDGYAATRSAQDPHWRVISTRLEEGIANVVAQLAGGTLVQRPQVNCCDPFEIHEPADPLLVPITFLVTPAGAGSYATATLTRNGQAKPVFSNQKFDGDRLVSRLSPGDYVLDVTAKAPYQGARVPCSVVPLDTLPDPVRLQ